jgi:mannose-6-phosphate isomerase-like protein (cupin superfamily)
LWTEVAISALPSSVLAKFFWDLENDCHCDAVKLTCQCEKRFSRLHFHIGGINYGQPPGRQPLGGQEVQNLESIRGGGLIIFIVRNHSPEKIGRQDFGESKMFPGESGLATAGVADDHHEAKFWNYDLHREMSSTPTRYLKPKKERMMVRHFVLSIIGSLVLTGMSLCGGGTASAQTQGKTGALSSRIAHTDPSKYQHVPKVHGGAGSLAYMGLFGPSDFNTNLIFLHRGVLQPKSGIGHHFHNQMEEMFVIFDNSAQFTIDGRTSELTGPAAAPCRMGSSHGIYNPTDRPTQWMNIAISSVRGRYDAFDLNDDRVGVTVDPKPVFIHVQMDKNLLQPVKGMNGGKGTVQYRRMLRPEIFRTNWGYVDHLLIPPDSGIGYHRHEALEEIFYVLAGKGRVTVEGETAEVGAGDAVPCRLGEAHSVSNNSQADLELMVIGVALEKGKFDVTDVSQDLSTK